jgi:hypothetical protein
LRYNRSRFFSFLFFIQKLSGKLWSCFAKVVWFFTRSPTKFVLHFSNFSMIFYGFSKLQPNCNSIEDSHLRVGPWTVLIPYRCTLELQIGPQKDLRPHNWVLGEVAGAARRNPARPAAAVVPERAKDGLRAS